MIIITADHGELLGEHGLTGHGKFLFQEELHIPLIVKYPGSEVSYREEDGYIQLIDILPMILNRLNIPLPEDIQGNIPPKIDHPILAEVYPLPVLTKYGEWRALYRDQFKFLWNSNGDHLLINLVDDPAESINLIKKYPDRAKVMELSMNQFIATLPHPGPSEDPLEIDEETKKALTGLGYIK